MPLRTSSTSEDAPTFVAVDFGGTKTAAARIRGTQVSERTQIESDSLASPEDHVESIVRLVESLRDKSTDGIGVAVTGRVDADGLWSTINNKTFAGFSDFPLADVLRARLGPGVVVMNDALAAAWGEYNVLPAGQEPQSFLYLTVSTGIGGGLVLNGRPFVSGQGLAGHFGFITSRLGTEICGCGRRGTVESVASGTAIGRAGSSGKEVYERHLAGDGAATAIVRRSAEAVAIGIADARALLDVQSVAIGGSVGLAEGYIDLVRTSLAEEPPLFVPELYPAILGTDAALIGVAIARTIDG